MLAKILPGGTTVPQAVQWPAAENCGSTPTGFTSVSMTPSEEQLLQAELNQLRQELALLKTELEHTRLTATRQIQESLLTGRREGEAAVRQVLEPQVESEITKLRQMIRDTLAAGSKLRHQAEEDLVRLAVAIARRILHREITVDIDALSGLVKAAFTRLDQREIHQVRTDPDSAVLVQRVLNDGSTARPINVVTDPSLRRGSLIIETAKGQLDASLETQLQEIQRGFTDIVTQS